MKFKPGDKVWVDHPGCEWIPRGTHAAIIVCEANWGGLRIRDTDGTPYWTVDIEGVALRSDGSPWAAPERIMYPRDDPPPQQEPKREELGSWDDCEWRPATVRFEMALREYTRRLEWEELTT